MKTTLIYSKRLAGHVTQTCKPVGGVIMMMMLEGDPQFGRTRGELVDSNRPVRSSSLLYTRTYIYFILLI